MVRPNRDHHLAFSRNSLANRKMRHVAEQGGGLARARPRAFFFRKLACTFAATLR
jgi:hypothetical protein